jgi:hypothetical protein
VVVNKEPHRLGSIVAVYPEFELTVAVSDGSKIERYCDRFGFERICFSCHDLGAPNRATGEPVRFGHAKNVAELELGGPVRDIIREAGWNGRPAPVARLPIACGGGSHPPTRPALRRVTSASPTAPTAAPATITGAPPPAIADSIIHSVVPDKGYLSPFDPPNPPPPVPWRQTARKPGSVPPTALPPWVGMAIPLGRPLPGASCDRPERRREGPPGISRIAPRGASRSYLVLLPVGFAVPPPLPAARCALTAPFHPCRPSVCRHGLGGVLSVALSLGSPPPGVTRHRTSVEPGLSSPRQGRRAAIRPSGG